MRTVILIAAAVAVAPQQQPTFRSRADVVVVDVSVRERNRVMTGLTSADFEVFDNDVLQQVSEVSYGKLPIDITVVLDISRSVTGPALERLRRAVTQLMRDLGSQDRLKLVTFNMRVSRVVDFTTNVADVEQALKETSGAGGSSIWDAVAVSLVSAAEPNRRQLVVLFSDGVDTSSTIDPPALLDLAQRTVASFSAVVPGGSPMGSLAGGPRVIGRPIPAVLSQLTAETGGTILTVGVGNPDLTTAFQRVLEQFRSSYVLHFSPTGVERGGFHALRVNVKGRKGLTITARRGYFW
jgi:VWFA-related protein